MHTCSTWCGPGSVPPVPWAGPSRPVPFHSIPQDCFPSLIFFLCFMLLTRSPTLGHPCVGSVGSCNSSSISSLPVAHMHVLTLPVVILRKCFDVLLYFFLFPPCNPLFQIHIYGKYEVQYLPVPPHSRIPAPPHPQANELLTAPRDNSSSTPHYSSPSPIIPTNPSFPPSRCKSPLFIYFFLLW